MLWQRQISDSLDTYVRAFTYIGTTIRDAHCKRIIVKVGAFRVELFTDASPIGKLTPCQENLCLTVPSEQISVGALEEHFTRRDAAAIYARHEYCRSAANKVWRFHEFPGGELVLARNIVTGVPLRPRWMAVVIHSNGATLHAKPVFKEDPNPSEVVAWFPASSLTLDVLQQYMIKSVASEVIAVYRFNRCSLLHVLRKATDDCKKD